MLSYAFLMPVCRKAHKKQPSSVNFTELKKKCLVKSTVSAKERGKLEDIAKVCRPHYESFVSP